MLMNFLVFLAPALSFIELNLVGRLFLPEIIVLGLVPFVLYRSSKHLLHKPIVRFIMLAALWLLGQMLTDLYRDTSFDDMLRGWSKILFFIVNFITMYTLISRNRTRAIYVTAGLAFGMIATYFLVPNQYAAEYPWKFGYGYAITIAIITSLTWAYTKEHISLHVVSSSLFALSAINFLKDFRSLAGICFISGILMLTMNYTRKSPKLAVATAIKIGVSGLAAVWISLSIYAYAASSGVLGEQAKIKYEFQSAGIEGLGPFGILLAGRAEMLVSTRAVLDSPILGHGSWARDQHYVNLMQTIQEASGMSVTPPEYLEDLIPTHSYLFGAWVEAGILGGVFFLWLLAALAFALAKTIRTHPIYAPLLTFICLGGIWDVLFSPLGAQARFASAFLLAAVFASIRYTLDRTHRQHWVDTDVLIDRSNTFLARAKNKIRYEDSSRHDVRDLARK
jgi:hypothetical protein